MELLRKLTQAYAPSGREDSLAELIKTIISSYVDEVYADGMGNLIAHKYGTGKKIMLAAHIDEIGLLVNYIDDKGFLRFAPLGGVMPYASLYQRVVFQNGVTGVVAYEEKADLKTDFSLEKMYIDIGASSREEAEKKVSIGDSAVFLGGFTLMGDIAISKALDNRAGAWVLINVIKNLEACTNDIYFVFSSQEELGCRGAKSVSNAVKPEMALSIDVTDTGDTPECKRMAVKLGDGPCIKYMDSSIITHKYVNGALRDSANKVNVNLQSEVLTFGGTDAGAIHTSGTGVMTGAISIPTRYIHTPSECISINDLKGAVDVITHFICRKFD